jgi:hypothetical protein
VYETFFDLTINLCERFPAYTPTGIRKERSTEIFKMLGRLNKHTTNKDKPKVIKKKAPDTWF